MDKHPQDELAVMLLGPGAAPLPKIEEEAIALLVACNSLLNSLALQGVNVPKALLTDLTIFCRNGVGFGVPFADVAKRAYPVDHGVTTGEHMAQMSHGLEVQSTWAADAARNVIASADRSEHLDAAKELLSRFAEMELIRERICGYMGWSRILINASARMSVDKREAAEQAIAAGQPE